MSSKRASVDHHGDQFVMSTYHRATNGWIAPDKPVLLPDSVTAAELGAAVRRALDGTRLGVQAPADPDSIVKPLLDAVGVSDYAHYLTGTTSVSVRMTERCDGAETVTVTPERNAGIRRGFEAVKERVTSFDYVSEEHLGREVLSAFSYAL